MNFSFFISKRIAFNKQKSFSRFIIRLSIAATALSVAVMIIATAFAAGFQNTISQKIFSFWGHIRVQHFELGKSAVAEETAILKSDTVETILKSNSNITHINAFATKSAVLEFNKNLEGVLIKGIEQSYDSVQMKPFLLQGRWLNFSDSFYSKEVVLSSNIANELQLKLGDVIKAVFINSSDGSTTYRKLTVVGIYKTGIEENDKLFAITDIRLIQRINNWNEHQIGGYEVFVNNYKNMQAIADNIRLPIIWDARSIKEVYPSIFDWLNVQGTNRNIVFIIMAIVAIINLITCLLILVLERVRMVGILKSLGANNLSIQKIFLYYAAIISFVGVGIGTLSGIGMCWLQQYTHWFKLDEQNYYVAYVPVEIIWWQIAIIASVTFLLCFIALILPTILIKRVEPVKAIRFN
ncbi:MAG: ABC transporter permease [Chitinophagaceae bacterium]|nr:ABC transporter permease [Chitinophagaceae bacterium]